MNQSTGSSLSNQDPLDLLRPECQTPADAVRWACVLEATAPKAGNVYPGRPFPDLSHSDFVTAAQLTASAIESTQALGFASWVLAAAQSVQSNCGSNVNLGILLLLGPLVECDRRHSVAHPSDPRTQSIWRDGMASVLTDVTAAESLLVFDAIRVANPGGMGTTETMDVNSPSPAEPVDLVAAMHLAQRRDRIARQYATGFSDLLDIVVPVVHDAIIDRGDVLGGIADAHLRLLASEPDSLIERKHGPEIAKQVRCMAAAVDLQSPSQREEFDRILRGNNEVFSQRCNPGTTADLIAAALYVLLRT
ncbi:triphosphoribosyl-dephospho-CoA synthase [Stieleria varia]|uniref:ATP:dephospho-CoA triphosphoribosyl transferase n=1 Tax=Stieleria varia TaxID=2528005 RepID=A0A5C6A553_9BACT|nr:triphosphoribosyl-dephospho-CoA synthase [Stieleria varia]TWT94507.1 ATP:dephospho-CoA triphosphoribosyl transferase [Stieleria varia]